MPTSSDKSAVYTLRYHLKFSKKMQNQILDTKRSGNAMG